VHLLLLLPSSYSPCSEKGLPPPSLFTPGSFARSRTFFYCLESVCEEPSVIPRKLIGLPLLPSAGSSSSGDGHRAGKRCYMIPPLVGISTGALLLFCSSTSMSSFLLPFQIFFDYDLFSQTVAPRCDFSRWPLSDISFLVSQDCRLSSSPFFFNLFFFSWDGAHGFPRFLL